MSDPLTPRERELARRISELRAAAERPVIAGGGLFGDALNFLTSRVPVWVIRSGLIVFIAYHAWLYDAKARQMLADTTTANREALRQEVEAEAMRQKLGLGTVAMATVLAELEKIQADRAKATAEVEAQGHIQEGATARLRILKAEIEKAEAERKKAEADLQAQLQLVENVPVFVRQKRAELESLKASNRTEIGTLRFMVETWRR